MTAPADYTCPLCEREPFSKRGRPTHERSREHRARAEIAAQVAMGRTVISTVTRRILERLGVETACAVRDVKRRSSGKVVVDTGVWGPRDYHRVSRAGFRAGLGREGREALVRAYHAADAQRREAVLAFLTLHNDNTSFTKTPEAVAALEDLRMLLGVGGYA